MPPVPTTPVVLAAELPPPPAPVVWDKDSVIALATSEAEKRGVNVEQFVGTIECEVRKENGVWVVDGKSYYPEDSWGVLQVNLPSHPTITKAQAQDPAFIVPWGAEQFANGRQRMWTCWRTRYG